MNRWLLLGVCVLAPAMAGCAVEKTENPLSPSVAGPIAGVAITAPTTIDPSGGTRLRSDQQPLTLKVANATTNGVRPLTYSFQVASDQAFTNIVMSQGGIAPGDGGRTSYKLGSALTPDRGYFWRARAEDGANTGSFSATAQFFLFSPATFQAPVPVSPIGGATVTSLRPRFSFNNAARTGSPEGGVRYQVDLSDSEAFTGVVSVTVAEADGGVTSGDPQQDLPAGRQAFWRVRASDSVSTGPWSATATFRTAAAAPAPAPAPPTGTASGAACQGGLLLNPKAYFFSLIGRSEGQSANDWYTVLSGSGLAGGPGPGVRPGSANYGITQQFGAGGPRGRLFLPTNTPDDLGYYTRQVDIITDGAGGKVWTWSESSTPPYGPRSCP